MPRRGSCVTAGLRAAWLLDFMYSCRRTRIYYPYFRYQFSLRQTCQYSTIHNTAWFFLANQIFEDPKKKLHFLDWSGTSLLLDAQKSKWREGLRFDAKWWILETNSPILKSIQAKAKSNSTKQSKESEYYMYIFITYLKRLLA